MCSGCSGGDQSDYEDFEPDEYGDERLPAAAGDGGEGIGGDHPSRWGAGGAEELSTDKVAEEQENDEPLEEGFEVLVGANHILEIRLVRANHGQLRGLEPFDSAAKDGGMRRMNEKYYRTPLTGSTPEDRAHRPLLIGFVFAGLAVFWMAALGVWLSLR